MEISQDEIKEILEHTSRVRRLEREFEEMQIRFSKIENLNETVIDSIDILKNSQARLQKNTEDILVALTGSHISGSKGLVGMVDSNDNDIENIKRHFVSINSEFDKIKTNYAKDKATVITVYKTISVAVIFISAIVSFLFQYFSNK